MAFITGKRGRLYANSVYWKIQKWSVTLPMELLDVTNGESGGFGEYIASIQDLEFTVDACHDVGSNPFATFVPGTAITGLTLIVSSGNIDLPWQINDARVEEVEEILQVRGAPVTYRLKGRASQTGVAGTGGNVSYIPETDTFIS